MFVYQQLSYTVSTGAKRCQFVITLLNRIKPCFRVVYDQSTTCVWRVCVFISLGLRLREINHTDDANAALLIDDTPR